jgi:hypothetical protein
VLVRIRASSLTHRDLMTVLDPERRAVPYPRIRLRQRRAHRPSRPDLNRSST